MTQPHIIRGKIRSHIALAVPSPRLVILTLKVASSEGECWYTASLCPVVAIRSCRVDTYFKATENYESFRCLNHREATDAGWRSYSTDIADEFLIIGEYESQNIFRNGPSLTVFSEPQESNVDYMIKVLICSWPPEQDSARFQAIVRRHLLAFAVSEDAKERGATQSTLDEAIARLEAGTFCYGVNDFNYEAIEPES